MKFTRLTLICMLVLLQGCSVCRHSSGSISVSCPDIGRVLPDYPKDEDRELFFNDSLLYERGKELRDSERGKQAIADADIKIDFFLKRFGEVMGVNLSEKDSPATFRYIKAVYDYAGKGIMNAKNAFGRQRPFRHFNEPTSIPEEEKTFGSTSSYPSGHSLMAWVVSLALMSIDKEHEYDIIRLGYEIGQSRVIAGFHYQSDVDAGRLAAGVAFAGIVSDPEFIKMMTHAGAELKELRAKDGIN